jgi:RNA polymerase sigma-70 factor (ECF subfamily)
VRPDPTSTIELQEGAEDEQVVAAVESADLREALADLSDRERRLLEMRYEEDLTQKMIALRLGIPEGTVKVRLHRVRDKLRRAYVVQ